MIAAVVAGPAGHHLPPGEVVAIDGRHHPDHSASPDLLGCVGCPIDFLRAGSFVAIRAIKTEGSAHDAHRPHEIVYGHVLQYLNVLEDRVRGLLSRGRLSLGSSERAADQPDNCHYGSRGTYFERSPPT